MKSIKFSAKRNKDHYSKNKRAKKKPKTSQNKSKFIVTKILNEGSSKPSVSKKETATAKIVSPNKKFASKKKGLEKEMTNRKQVSSKKVKKKPGTSEQVSQYSSNWEALKKELGLTTKKSRKTTESENCRLPESSPKPAEEEDSDMWFDDVDPQLLVSQEKSVSSVVAIDCEMVEVAGMESESILARVSLVNSSCQPVYDKFVKPTEEVTDFRTKVSGVRATDLVSGEDFSKVQREVADLIRGRVLVGHALSNDLKVLFLTHPKGKIRDTSKYKPFRALVNGRTPALKKLSQQLLGTTIQSGEHSSIVDAQAAMRLYTMHRRQWEAELLQKKKKKHKPRLRST